MTGHSSELRSVCTTLSQQPWACLHGNTPEFDAWSNGLGVFRDCKGPTTRANTKTVCKICEKADKTAERNVIWSRNQPARHHRPCRPTCSGKEKKQEDKSINDPFAAVHYREKKSENDQMNRNRRFKTFDDNYLETDWQEIVIICKQYAENLQETLDTLANFQHI